MADTDRAKHDTDGTRVGHTFVDTLSLRSCLGDNINYRKVVFSPKSINSFSSEI